jgi:hypothetical protein
MPGTTGSPLVNRGISVSSENEKNEKAFKETLTLFLVPMTSIKSLHLFTGRKSRDLTENFMASGGDDVRNDQHLWTVPSDSESRDLGGDPGEASGSVFSVFRASRSVSSDAYHAPDRVSSDASGRSKNSAADRGMGKDRYTLVQCVSLESNDGGGNAVSGAQAAAYDRSVTPLSGNSFTSVASNVKRLEWDSGADVGCQLLLAPVSSVSNQMFFSESNARQSFLSRGSGRSVEDQRVSVLSRETRKFVERKRANSLAELNASSKHQNNSRRRDNKDNAAGGLQTSSTSKSSSQLASSGVQSSSSSPSNHSRRSNASNHSPEKIQQQSQKLANSVYSSASVVTVVSRPSPRHAPNMPLPAESAREREEGESEGHCHPENEVCISSSMVEIYPFKYRV